MAPLHPRSRRAPIPACLLLGLALIALLAGCKASPPEPDLLNRILARGELRVLTRNNAHCYYNYRDEPMGFEHDLARAFAESLGVELRVITPSWEDLIPALEHGEGDLIAASLTRTETRRRRVAFCEPYLSIQQRLIRRKGVPKAESLAELAGRTVHVRRGSSYQDRLAELATAGVPVEAILHEELSTEELIRRVAVGEIDLTVADTNVALLNRRYYPEIRLDLVLAESQSLGWAIPKGEGRLRESVDAFFRTVETDGTLSRIYNRYYANVEVFDYVDLRSFKRRLKTRLPKYQPLIESAAREHGFDWRLIAAVVYQESHFNPRARSHSGVRGIMQLTLTTARDLGIENRLDPEASVRGGVAYLKHLYELFDEAEGPDRLYLALASYNVGRGHVLDAQKLAARRGMAPQHWDSVAQTLPLLAEREHYEKSRYGYCRGSEPVRYIQRIQTYYEILKREAIDYREASTGGNQALAD